MDWLDQQREAHLSRPVTYQRGGESVEIAATLGATSVGVTDDAGATVQSPQTDFIVSADALVLGGVVVTPQVGDRISLTSGGKAQVYEVLSLPDGRHFRRCDGSGRMLRIHAKQVDEVTN
ncbi:MAG: hypothetical protein BWX88_04605 [Planctomycetes bacterium ADurb.Bin126]|nr:MAG: hypothetical protein BWX88_04605 [Planctomycetes bacterium ADurb.Bin126]